MDFKLDTESTMDIYTDGSKKTGNNTGCEYLITHPTYTGDDFSESDSYENYIIVLFSKLKPL